MSTPKPYVAGKIPDSQDVTCAGLSLALRQEPSPLGAEEVYGTVGYVMASASPGLAYRQRPEDQWRGSRLVKWVSWLVN